MWWFGLVHDVIGGVNKVIQCWAWMADRQQAGKPSRYVTSHGGQLSLAIPPWVMQ